MADKKICSVCGGKGGWKIKRNNPWDNDWNDCLYCDGYGFIDADSDELDDAGDKLQLFMYNGYKRLILDALEPLGNVIYYHTRDKGLTVEIGIVEKDKKKFFEVAQTLLRFHYYNSSLEVKVSKDFHYNPERNTYHYYWALTLIPREMEDLDGFIDVLHVFSKGRDTEHETN